MSVWEKYASSRLGRSIVTVIATAQTNASVATTPFAAQVRQIRVAGNVAFYATVGTAATITSTTGNWVPANWVEYWTVNPGQVLNFISTSTSTGWVSCTEML